MEQIIYLKLLNGEDIVATLLEETNSEAIITNPLQIRTVLNPLNNLMLSGFYSWIPIKEIINSKFILDKNNIMAMVTVPEDVITAYNGYLNNTSSKDDEKESEESKNSNSPDDLSDLREDSIEELLLRTADPKTIH